MIDDRFLTSRYWRWYLKHERPHPETQELGREALTALVESINTGEIMSFDGVDTLLSKEMRVHHGVDNFEMNSNWIGSSQQWTCPCCDRSKFQISRLGKKGQILAKSVVHHDHMGEAMKAGFNSAFQNAGTSVEQVEGLQLVERMSSAFAAYAEVLICEDCNNADTEAKKVIAAPQYFSFSIGQIRQFIESGDHRPHGVNSSVVQTIWNKAKPAYDLRMNIIRAVAHAAATDTHWYEPHPKGEDPVPVFGWRPGDGAVKKWVSGEALFTALGPKSAISQPNLSRWRDVPQKSGKPLPANFLAMLRSDEAHAAAWESVPDDWNCPVCKRVKHATAYVGEKGKVIFFLTSTSSSWSRVKICNHCKSTVMSLKLEFSAISGERPNDSYGFVLLDEVASIIVPRPNSSHLIRADAAQELVSSVVERALYESE